MKVTSVKLISLKFVSLIILILICYISLALSVDNAITSDDEAAIRSLNLDQDCTGAQGIYQKEIRCLSKIQRQIQSIGQHRCPGLDDVIEPMNFINRGYGCCFDRARFIEKAARNYGFQTRHVFLISPAWKISITNILPLNQDSHAASEVLTSRGWLGVDSNEPFLLLTKDGYPSTYRNAINNIQDFEGVSPQGFFRQKVDVIYGLYSRHGKFHGKNFPGPEYVLSEVFFNFE